MVIIECIQRMEKATLLFYNTHLFLDLDRAARRIVDDEEHTVRRHINWNNHRPDLKEDLAHLVQDIKRRICGIASAGSPSFSV